MNLENELDMAIKRGDITDEEARATRLRLASNKKVNLPIENQVCSLELAKRLKKLGVKQSSYFYYLWTSQRGQYEIFTRHDGVSDGNSRALFPENYFSAFTVAELGILLPHHIASHQVGASKWYWVCYDTSPDNRYPEEPTPTAETEADARAKMLIYLLENGLMTLEGT